MKLLIGAKQLQRYLQLQGHYKGKIDGAFGPKSEQAAIDIVVALRGPQGWSKARHIVGAQQMLFVDLGLLSGAIDGLAGPNTYHAQELYQNLMRDTPGDKSGNDGLSTKWPTYREMERFYGPVGQNIERFKAPYSMVLAWDTDARVKNISLHEKCGPSAIGVMEAARDHYGGDAAMRELNLHLFGGSLNVRKMRGGSQWSTHSWAAAIDFDPSHNQFRWTDSRATLDNSEYDKWWELWEAAGWVSLGRERNFDWMHVQAVRL